MSNGTSDDRLKEQAVEKVPAKANLESSVAIRNAAKSLTKRSYEDVKLRNALADIAFARL